MTKLNAPLDNELTELMKAYKQIVDEEQNACNLLDIQIENLQEERDKLALPFKDKLART